VGFEAHRPRRGLELDGSARVHHERQGEVERLGQCSGFSPDLGREQVGLDERMRARVRSLPDVAELLVAYVCAGWMRFPSGTEFVTFWGGLSLPAWRGRGIYRALVAHRANLSAERGRRYIEVDASDNSRPILERLGFVAVTTTTPCVWSPPTVPEP
jgi:GNAT superfamily N-acetyltransferase